MESLSGSIRGALANGLNQFQRLAWPKLVQTTRTHPRLSASVGLAIMSLGGLYLARYGDHWRLRGLLLALAGIGGPMLAFLPPRRRRGLTVAEARQFAKTYWRPLLLLLISVGLACLYMWGRPYVMYDDGDPQSYIRKAWALVGREGGANLAYRGPGYPLFLIVSGVAMLDTWWLLLASQVLMAAAMPLLVYGMLSPFTPNGGFIAALCFMSFGAAYNHMNWVMAEELFLFVQFLALFLMSRHFRDPGSIRALYAISALCAYAAMIRPGAALYFWIFLFVCLAYRHDRWTRYLGPAALYVGAMLAWGAYDYYYGQAAFSGGFFPQSRAQRYFAEVYYGRDAYRLTGDLGPTIRPEDGPASAKLYETVRAKIAASRGSWGVDEPTTARNLYDRFGSEELLANIFTKPNFNYFGFAVNAVHGAGLGDALLYEVAREHGNVGAAALLRNFAAHPQIPIMGAPQTYAGRMFLANFYRYTEMDELRKFFMGRLEQNLVTEEAGPAAKELLGSLAFMIDNFPQYTVRDANKYLEIFGTTAAFKQYLKNPAPMQLPDGRSVLGMLEGSTFGWASLYYGEIQADRLMRNAAIEVLRARPGAALVFYDNLVRILIMRHFYINYSDPAFSTPANIWEMVKRSMGRNKNFRSASLPSDLARNLVETNDFNNNVAVALQIQYYWLWRMLKLVFFLGMAVFSIPLMRNAPTSKLAVYLLLFYFYNAAVLSIVVGNFDLPRYEDPFVFIPIMMTILGIAVQWSGPAAREASPAASGGQRAP